MTPMTPRPRRLSARINRGIIIAFVLGMIYILFFHVDERDARMTGTARATVVTAESTGRSNRYEYRYVVGGRTYQGSALLSGFAFAAGSAAIACFDPEDPSQSMLKRMDSSCGPGAG
ncbi:MAG: hypothetical protein JWN21_638 [Sphingomonas bacterium]|uniref:DUF3592 domain-containing protein n=1 Tax=Sphingomonas bacterium TaxID=1895847 RepID=UPI002616489E|nr:DUF3592 domain-containing protein [Sphingomonas bacterium]MDB5695095.1 hypothetical protein [Sphingomonas bacterium]